MKIGSKRGSNAAVLDAPEELYASGSAAERTTLSGSLRREFDADEDARAEALERPAFSRRRPKNSSGVRVRVHGLPRTLGGRILAGAASLAVLLVLAVAAVLIRQFLLHSSRFLLRGPDQVELLGNRELSRAQALTVFSNDFDRNLFHMPLSERKDDLERLPWVEHATVMRLLPNRLRVSIVERTPVAFVRQGTQIGLVDATGVLLDMPSDAAGDPHYSFPVLTGIDANDPISTRRARMDLYMRFMNAMAAGGEQVVDSLSEVDVTEPEDVKAIIARDGSDILVHFGDQQFLERFRVFDSHLAEWKQAYPKLTSADLRYNKQIVLDSGTNQATPVQETGASADPSAANGDAAPAAAFGSPAAAAPAQEVPAKPAPAQAAPRQPARAARKTPPTHAKLKPAAGRAASAAGGPAQ